MHVILKIGLYLDKPLLPTLNIGVCKVMSNRFAFRVATATLDGELDWKGKEIVSLFLNYTMNSKNKHTDQIFY